MATSIKLGGQIQSRHGGKLERTCVDRKTLAEVAEVSVEIVEGYGDNLPIAVEVVNDLVCVRRENVCMNIRKMRGQVMKSNVESETRTYLTDEYKVNLNKLHNKCYK